MAMAQQWGFLGSIEGGHCGLLMGLLRQDGGGRGLCWLGVVLVDENDPPVAQLGALTGALVGIQGALLTSLGT